MHVFPMQKNLILRESGLFCNYQTHPLIEKALSLAIAKDSTKTSQKLPNASQVNHLFIGEILHLTTLPKSHLRLSI